MKLYFFLLMLIISSCSSHIDYIKNKLEPQPLLLGYQSIVLKDGISPEHTIKFEYNSTEISNEDIQFLGSMIDDKRYYIIEGTAGTTNKGGFKIAQERALKTIDILQSQGIKAKDIYIAEYDPSKPGRQVNIYTLKY